MRKTEGITLIERTLSEGLGDVAIEQPLTTAYASSSRHSATDNLIVIGFAVFWQL
jgi:hypothetical protein